MSARKTSEITVGAALRSMDLRALVYKIPDDARNRKPADFLVVREGGRAAFVEVKTNPNQRSFPMRAMRAEQLLAMQECYRLGIPYWLVVWWPKGEHAGLYTVSNTNRLMRNVNDKWDGEWPHMLAFSELRDMGDACLGLRLTSYLAAALRGEFD